MTDPKSSRFVCLFAASILCIANAKPCVAAIETRNTLKTYFETGDVPTQEQFADLIDSAVNLIDDGLTVYSARDAGGRAPRLDEGETVGPDLTFAPLVDVSGFSGDWMSQSGFLPLAFEQDSQLHYAYLQISSPVPGAPNPWSMIVEYLVYDDVPNTPLLTQTVPEPTTAVLAVLAGLSLLARRAVRRKG
jgi:hypothetical protein